MQPKAPYSSPNAAYCTINATKCTPQCTQLYPKAPYSSAMQPIPVPRQQVAPPMHPHTYIHERRADCEAFLRSSYKSGHEKGFKNGKRRNEANSNKQEYDWRCYTSVAQLSNDDRAHLENSNATNRTENEWVELRLEAKPWMHFLSCWRPNVGQFTSLVKTRFDLAGVLLIRFQSCLLRSTTPWGAFYDL
jgi:hypothetical protein